MLIANISFAQGSDQNNTYSFDVEITGFRSNNGHVLAEVVNAQKEVVKSFVLDLKNKKCTFTLADLPEGKYAIRYFHDENDNQKMDSNFVGIPKEGYGFSNNAKAYFGPPSFSAQLFDLDANQKMNLEISYLF